MFSSFDDWWERAGRWQRAARLEMHARTMRREEWYPRDTLPQVRMFRREFALHDAAIMAMLDACPDYDGDLSEFGEEPAERLIRIGVLPPYPWGRAR